jgi:hypothetical protein
MYTKRVYRVLHRGLPRAGKFAVMLAAMALVGAFGAGAGVAGNPGSSSPTCTLASATSQPFLPWNDSNQYFLAPGGAMESDLTAAGWQLSGGAGLAGGNEPYRVTSALDGSSLSLPAGSSATTAPVCVTIHDPEFRAFARNQGDPNAQLAVDALFTGNNGQQTVKRVGYISAGSSWALSDPVKFVKAIQPGPDGLALLSFRFTPTSGNFSLDDLYIDPLKSQDGFSWGGGCC